MASFVYDSYFYNVYQQNVNFAADTFYVMLCTSSYTPSRTDAHRSDVTAYEVSGTGYTAGGNAVTVTISATDTTNNQQSVVLGGTTWSSSTITARYAVYYKHRGGAASADEIIAVNDFGSNVSSVSGTFTLNSSTSLTTMT